jgi:hypothetical protein
MIVNFKVFEGMKESIPDELAIWFMDFFAQQTIKFIEDVNKIPSNLFQESYNLVKEMTKNTLVYRGESRDYEITKPIRFSPKNNAGISWSYEKEIAMGFIEPDSEDMFSYLYTLDLKDVKYPVSLDLVMDKITERQKKLITNPITRSQISGWSEYNSEKEILVFDTFYSDILKIEVIS